MAVKGNPRRYAQAVFEIALETRELDRWQSDLRKIAEAVSDSSFLAVLESQKIKIADKERFLKETLGGIGPLAMNLVMLLVSRSGIGMVPEVATEFKKRLDKYRGIETAQVTTAVPLDDKDKDKLKTQLGALTGVEIELKTEVDPAILGGIVARVGGKLLDGSTRSKLAALKKELAGRG